jgi:hypothetical protein
MMRRTFAGVFVVLLSFSLVAQEKSTELLERLKNIEGIEVIPLERFNYQFKEAYQVMFTQPVDHNDPDGETFTQRMFIGHAGFDRPMVLSTSGYDADRLGYCEPAGLLKSNMIRVEHRYFGESAPDPLEWEYLTVWQASTDLHEIVDTFDDLYQGKWVSTGHSKDGQTAIMFKAYYPEDIDVAIPYVAPLNTGKVDPRIFEFLDNVGTKQERKKVNKYQIALFENKDKLMPLVEEMAENQNWTFTMGIERGFDLAVLEFPFAMWQYGQVKPMDLPGKDASPEELLKPLNRVSALYFFSEDGIVDFLPHYYQAMTEMGYYGYDVKPFKKYLPDRQPITWDFTLTPYGIDTTFRPGTLEYLHDFVQNKGDHILYIYGEYDTWTATGVTEITGSADALVMIQPEGYHGARIQAFPGEDQEKIYATLTRWLGMAVPAE